MSIGVKPALTVEEAQQRLIALVEPLAAERVAVRDAVGRFLAEPLYARRTQPAGDLAAMDGYAVRHDGLRGPWQIVGESAAGHPYPAQMGAGEAVRIATGALVPCGADCVIVQEDVSVDAGRLILRGDPPRPPGKHIRREGGDFRTGAVLLPGGARLGPAQIALALSGGHGHLDVRRPARVAIVDSGDELAGDPALCPRHQIPASNAVMLAAMLARSSHRVTVGPAVPDDVEALVAALDANAEADVVVTTGGASVGDHDVLKPALARWGADVDFWRVAIKPGKPVLVARRGRRLILGLPGNPAASFVTALFFLLPLVRRLQGASAPFPRSILQRLAAPLPGTGPRREFLRARWSGDAVVPLPSQDSGALASLAATELLIDRPAFSPAVGAGTDVAVFPLAAMQE